MRSLVVSLAVLSIAACDNAAPAADGGVDGMADGQVSPGPQTLTHEFEPISIASGEEIAGVCQTWDLGNETPLFVRTIRSDNDGAWHHSNWMWAPTPMFDGPEATWRCRDRGWDEVVAGFAGGVFFAQSTQALAEAQELPEGTAIRIPPNTSVTGSVHLLNTTPTALDSSIRFEVDTVAEEDVETVLHGISFTNLHLRIPPRQEAQFTMTCDLDFHYQRNFGKSPDFKIYYVLPHYHTLGNYFRLGLRGGSRDGETIFEQTSTIGEPLGQTLAVPLDVTGGNQIEFTCGYNNPTDRTVRFGIGDQEMCVFLAFTDAPIRFVGQSTQAPQSMGMVDGVEHFQGDCQVLGILPN